MLKTNAKQQSAAQPSPAPSAAATNFPATNFPATSDPVEKINTAVMQFDTTTANRVQQLATVHQARLTQFNRIATTVTAQSGADSTQANTAAAVVTASHATIARVAMLRQQVTAQAPAVTAAGWALYGTVYHSTNAPASAYSLYFVDATNTYQNAFGIAYTSADGSFQFVYTGPPAVQKAPTTQLFLQVGNASGEPVYTSKTAFTPTTGAAIYQIVTLPPGEKPLGVMPTVLRSVTLPEGNKPAIEDAANTDQNPEPKG